MYLRFHDARCHISLHQVQGNWSYHKRKTLLGYSRLFSQKNENKTISLPGLRGGCNKVKTHYLSVTSWRNVCLWPKVGLRILDLRRTLLVWNARLSALCNNTGASKFASQPRHVRPRLWYRYLNSFISNKIGWYWQEQPFNSNDYTGSKALEAAKLESNFSEKQEVDKTKEPWSFILHLSIQ